jgi:hypothetical protein
MAWSAEFATPILVPAGGQLRTLSDAREFLSQLRSYEANSLEWQCAIAAVLLVGETGCSADIARAALVEAIRRNGEAVGDAAPTAFRRTRKLVPHQ